MCILIKLDYAKFGLSDLFFFSKIIEEKPLGCRLDPSPLPPFVKKGFKTEIRYLPLYSNQIVVIPTLESMPTLEMGGYQQVKAVATDTIDCFTLL